MISARTKAVLAATKAQGVRLGRPENLRGQDAGRERAADLLPIIAGIRASGARSLREIAAGLNSRGIPTARRSVVGGVAEASIWSGEFLLRPKLVLLRSQAALNLNRISAWLSNRLLAPTRTARFAALAA